MKIAMRIPQWRWRGAALAGAMMAVTAVGVVGMRPQPAGAQAPAVTLYQHINYGGTAKTFTGDVPSLRPYSFNDEASSIRVPAGVKVALFEHDNYQGACETFTGSDPDLRDNKIGNDRVSSLRVGKDCPGAVLHYERSSATAAIAEVIGIDKDNPDLRTITWNDKATGIDVLGGTVVSLYEHINYQGTCEAFTANDGWLGDNAIGAYTASSIRIGAGCPAPAPTACPVSDADQAIDAEEQALLTLINQYRAQNGRGALTFKTEDTRAAAWFSRDMATRNYFPANHVDTNGRDPGARLTWCGAGWSAYAENIAAGAADAQSVFDMWRNSAGHNANMLAGNVRFAGIARAYNAGTSYGWYWTLDLTN